MLRKRANSFVGVGIGWARAWFTAGPSRIRLRRRLYLFSLPVVFIALLIVVKMGSVVVIGESSRANFTSQDVDALASDIAWLQTVDIVEPAKSAFADGDLQVIEGRLTEAEGRFEESLNHIAADQSCPVRTNLAIVREVLGDRAVSDGEKARATEWYTDAKTVVTQAPAGCFGGSTDPNSDRRDLMSGFGSRLDTKIAELTKPPAPLTAPPPPITLPPAPPSPPPLAPTAAPIPEPSPPSAAPPVAPPPEPAPAPGGEDESGPVVGPSDSAPDVDGPSVLDSLGPDRLPVVDPNSPPRHQLGPRSVDPLEQLQILLDNANAYGDNSE